MPQCGPGAPGKHNRREGSDRIDSFVGTPYAETTAALTGIRALVTETRIGRELEASGTRCRTG